MLREFAWGTFEKTGFIDAYIFYREIGELKSKSEGRKIAEEEVAISN